MRVPHIITSEVLFKGKLVTVRADHLSCKDEKQYVREVAVVTDSVAIVAIDTKSKVLLIQQYRHPMQQSIWEIPAGRIDVSGESPEETALRELREEADIIAERIEVLTVFSNSVGWTTERTHVFLAHNLTSVPAFERHNEEADIEKRWIHIDEAVAAIESGEIDDSKTIIGILLASARLKHVV